MLQVYRINFCTPLLLFLFRNLPQIDPSLVDLNRTSTLSFKFVQLKNLSLSSYDQYLFKVRPSELIVNTSIFSNSVSLWIWKYLSSRNNYESGSSPSNNGIPIFLNLFRSPASSSLSDFSRFGLLRYIGLLQYHGWKLLRFPFPSLLMNRVEPIESN